MNLEIALKCNKEFLQYGNDLLSSTELKIKGTHLKKKVLFPLMGIIQSYSESINKIIIPPNIYDKSAEIIMRSIFEAIINITYVYSCRTETNAAIFLTDEWEEKISFAKKQKALMQKYPTWNLNFGSITKPDEWDLFVLEQKNEMKKMSKKYKLTQTGLPPLEQRAQICDTYLKSKNNFRKGNSIEFIYDTLYGYFSQPGHANASGIGHFYRKNTGQKDGFYIDGNNNDLESVLTTTFAYYYFALSYFAKEFGVYEKKDFKKYKDQMEMATKK